MVKPKRRTLGRLGDNLLPNQDLDSPSISNGQIIAQEQSIEVPVDVAQSRSSVRIPDEGVKSRRLRFRTAESDSGNADET